MSTSQPVNPLDGTAAPYPDEMRRNGEPDRSRYATPSKGPAPRMMVTPKQGVIWGEPIYNDDGSPAKAKVKMRGRDIDTHAHDTQIAQHMVPVSVPAHVGRELIDRGLATVSDPTIDVPTIEALEAIRNRAANSPYTKI